MYLIPFGADQTIKVASKKDSKNGNIKLKKSAPKHNKPGNWMDGSIVEGRRHVPSPQPSPSRYADVAQEDKKKGSNPPTSAAVSPGPVVNQLEDSARETFATGRPLEDPPELQQCKHCKKSILKTAAKAHVAACLKVKKEKAQRKKEAREARERAKEAAREEEAKKNDDDDGKDEDSDEDDKKAGKKAASKKPGDDKVSKKRKADTEAEKAPKSKKKKDEPKAKLPKPKGRFNWRQILSYIGILDLPFANPFSLF